MKPDVQKEQSHLSAQSSGSALLLLILPPGDLLESHSEQQRTLCGMFQLRAIE